MGVYFDDVMHQAEHIKRALPVYASEEYLEKYGQIKKMKPRKVVFCGMGSSNYSSFGAGVLLNQTGITCQRYSASELLHYEMGTLIEDTLLVITSQSGKSAEILNLLKVVPDGIKIAAITNCKDGDLVRRADVTFNMSVENETAPSTRTYLASVILSDSIAVAASGANLISFLTDVKIELSCLETFLCGYENEENKISRVIAGISHIAFMGRGYSLSSAYSAALFMREAAKFPAVDFESAEFRHGPLEAVDPDFLGVVFAPSGKTYELNIAIAEQIVKCSGRAIVITDGDYRQMSENMAVIKQQHACEVTAPISEIAAAQAVIIETAKMTKTDMDIFRNASKVTTLE